MGIRSDFFQAVQRTHAKLKFLEEISELKGTKVGIDGTGWLSSGGSGNPKFFIDRCQRLRSLGIEPIFVFDREAPTMKKIIKECGSASAFNGTRYCGLPITNALAEAKVEVIFAPFEADSQLQYLMSINYIYAVMSDDGDMIFRGIARVIYEWNLHPDKTAKGNCRFFRLPSLLKELEEKNASFQIFQQACLLLGSDYHPQIQQRQRQNNQFSNIKYNDAISLIRSHGSIQKMLSKPAVAANFKCEKVEVSSHSSESPESKRRRRENAAYFTGDLIPILRNAIISAFCQSVQDPVLDKEFSVDYSGSLLFGVCGNVEISTLELDQALANNGGCPPEQIKAFDKTINDQFDSYSQMATCLKDLQEIRFRSQLGDFYFSMDMLYDILKLENGNKHFLKYNGAEILKEAMLICEDKDLVKVMPTVVACSKEEKNVREAFVKTGYFNFFFRMLSSSGWCEEGFELLQKFLKRDDKRFHQEPYLQVEGLCGCNVLLNLGTCTFNAKTSDMNQISKDIVKYFAAAHEAEPERAGEDLNEFARGFVVE